MSICYAKINCQFCHARGALILISSWVKFKLRSTSQANYICTLNKFCNSSLKREMKKIKLHAKYNKKSNVLNKKHTKVTKFYNNPYPKTQPSLAEKVILQLSIYSEIFLCSKTANFQ